MSADERRTIDELKARYDLEPDLRDVYVEGSLDAAVVDWVLRENDCRNAAVYEIETVDIADAVLDRHRLEIGEKGRVIALCLELHGHLQSDNQVTGIVDRDYDYLLGKTYTCPLLLFTDYACMEMYFFNELVMTKFLHFVLRRTDQSIPALLGRLQTVLQETFIIRSANQFLKLGLKWLEVKGQCKVTTRELRFNSSEFIRKYLNKNAKLPEEARFTATVESFRPRLHADARHQMHGHDFVHLLGMHVHNLTKNKNLADEEVIEKNLTTCLDYTVLACEPLFVALIQRVR